MLPSTNIGAVQRFRLINRSPNSLEVWLEPLGDRVMIPGGATYEVHLEVHTGGQACDCLGIAIEEKRATIYGWLQSIFVVTGDGGRVRVWPEA